MMTKHLQLICTTACMWLLATAQTSTSLDKWSRQLEATEPGISDSFDWIPLAQPAESSTNKDRSANGRVLTYSQSFPPSARFGELGKASLSAKPTPFEFPYHFQNFNNPPQPQSIRQSNPLLKGQEPTSQSFFKFEMPFTQQNSQPSQLAPPGVNTGYQISHAFGNGAQATVFNSPLFNQQPASFPHEYRPLPQKPLSQPLQQKPLSQQNLIDDPISLKNFFKENKPLPTQNSNLNAVTPQVFPDLTGDNPFSLRNPYNSLPSAPPQSVPSLNQDNQFLYVPYNDIFNLGAPQSQPSAQQQPPQTKFNSNFPTVNPYHINQFYTPEPQQQQNLFTTSTTVRPQTTSLKPQNVFQNFINNNQFSTVAPKPKPKAHQPPLAMFLYRSTPRPAQGDIVQVLSLSKNIAVIDAPTSNTPEIFVGPGGMPIPSGYTKFNLPYLSQLQSNNLDINDVPYFVAPLSYRTPGGFKKILLPEPHVGSIVINLSKSGQPPQQSPQQQPPPAVEATQPNLYYQPQAQQNEQPTTHRPRTSTHRVKATRAPSRGNKFSYYYEQDPIEEVPSPQVQQKDRPKKKRPQSSKVEQTVYPQQLNDPYAPQFNPIPNQITTDDYFKLATRPSSSSSSTSTTSTSTSTSTSTTSTTEAPQTYFGYNTQAQVEFPGSSGHIYHNVNQVSPQPQEEKPRLTTRPPARTTTAEEEYRMKQYYKQQNANRNRPTIPSQTNSQYDQIQYTPIDFEYDVSPKTTTTVKPRITFFSPTAGPAQEDEDYNTLQPTRQPQEINNNYNKNNNYNNNNDYNNNNLPANHRPTYVQNEITDSPVEYDPNPYELPSELPALTPNLPGLVNNLKDQQATAEQTTLPPTYEQETSIKPTRRPINRIRKPTKSSTESYSESDNVTRRPINRVRRPFGTRNNVASAITTNLETQPPSGTTTTTRRPTSARNNLVRNPNRVRYQPTPEERQTLRIKNKKKYNGSSKVVEQVEDLEYQRDVLKQNYPVFKPSGSRRPSSPTAIPNNYELTTTEAPTSETQQIYTVTPSNNIENEQVFPAGLLEPMQIAQQYNNFKDNYGPGYFPNQEDLNPTEALVRNEVNPVYTTFASSSPAPTTTEATTLATTTTTTTEAPQVVSITTRRSPFIRRNYPRLRTTTTEAPTTTAPASEEKPLLRNRLPPRKVIKVRTRNRRPLHPASSTSAPEQENESTDEPKYNYRKVNRYNQDTNDNDNRKVNRYNQDTNDNETPTRRRYKTKFQLEGQESQWSPAVKIGPTNNFKPVNPKDQRYNKHKFEEEPEIVTVGPESGSQENYEVKVSANFGPSASNEMKTQFKEPNLKPEKSFAELLEEVMGKAPEANPIETTTEVPTDGTIFESQKTTIANRLNRRGKWKKTRVVATQGNGETFETAESQNLGSQLLNKLQSKEKTSYTTVDITRDWKTTTPMTTAAEINAMSDAISTTPMTLISMEEYGITTSKPYDMTTIVPTMPMYAENEDEAMKTVSSEIKSAVEENATRRMDDSATEEEDLEIQPSLFSEVKKQLHDLFSIEEGDDNTGVTAALAAVGKRRQEYTNIKRSKIESTTVSGPDFTEPMTVEDKKTFHRELMKHVVYATSSPAKEEETSEAEICYRGRCIKSDDLPANHKLN